MKVQSKIFNIFTDIYYYKFVMIIVGFFYIFPYTMDFMGKGLKISLIWGVIVVTITYLKDKSILNNKLNWLLWGFLLLSSIGVFANYKMNFLRDLIDWCYLIVFCLSFIYIDKNKSKDFIYKEILSISYLLIFISLIVSLVSFSLYIFDFKSSVVVQGREYLFGTFENRLYGALGNPNSGALLSMISIYSSIFSLLILKQNNKKISKGITIFISFNIVLQLIVCFLSNSRSVLVSLIAGSAIIYFALCKKYITNNNIAIKIVSYTLIISIGCSALYGVSKVSNKIIGYLPTAFSYFNNEISDDSNNKKIDTIVPKDNDRIYKTNDVSNGRIGLWKADLKVAKQYIFTGVGNANVLEKVYANLLDNTGTRAANTHNVYLQILVAGGILPLLCILVYFGTILIKTFKKLFNKLYIENDMWLYCFLFSFIFALMVENIFESNIIGFMNLLTVPVFWSYLGYILDLITRKENLLTYEEYTVSNQ